MVAALRYLDTFTKLDGAWLRRAPTHPRLERDTPIPAMNQQMPRSARSGELCARRHRIAGPNPHWAAARDRRRQAGVQALITQIS